MRPHHAFAIARPHPVVSARAGAVALAALAVATVPAARSTGSLPSGGLAPARSVAAMPAGAALPLPFTRNGGAGADGRATFEARASGAALVAGRGGLTLIRARAGAATVVRQVRFVGGREAALPAPG